MSNNIIYAVHVGVSGFPFGSAAINKCISVYNVLAEENLKITIINNRATHSKNIPIEVKKKSFFGKLFYLYTTPSPYRPHNFFIRRVYNIIGRINEFYLLNKLAIKGKIDILFFYPKGFFFELVLYWVLSKIYNFSIISHYVEFRSAFVSRRGLWKRINDFLFDNYFFLFVDGIFPISEFLIKHLKHKGNIKPYIKIPPIVDFSIFDAIKVKNSNKYFLYAGSIGYYDALSKVLKAFCNIDNDEYYLFLVLNGADAEIKRIREEISSMNRSSRIKIFSRLKYEELIKLYVGAKALLLPLSDSIQDRARFPHKIAEYLASKNPIITTENGEIRYYLAHSKNALIGKENNVESLSSNMNFVIQYPEKAKQIGLNGYEVGLKFFNSKSYQNKLRDFIDSIVLKKKSF